MSTPLYEQIYDFIVNEVRQRRLAPGDMVPSEKSLAHQFNVSRITSKTSLERLANVGIVKRIKGKGTFVAQDALDKLQALADEKSASVMAAKTQPTATDLPICGLILPDFSETFALGIVHSIEKHCSDLGMKLLLKRSYGRQTEENQAIQDFLAIGVRGLIIFPVNGEYYNEQLLRLVLNRFPVVLIDRYLKGIPACCVYTDNRSAAQELTVLLLGSGHKHIGFVSPPSEKTSTIEDRLRGFVDAHSASDAVFNPQHVMSNLLSTLPNAFNIQEQIQHDEDCIREFVMKHPEVTAFVASEYNIALLLYETLEGMGKSVPEDYAIACFDSAPYVFGIPLFTHVEQDEEAIGARAVEALAAQIHGDAPQGQQTVPFRIVHGKSTTQQ